MESPLHDRMNAAVGARTFRGISELTGTNAETVRRYMQGQAPSVEFVATLCAVLGVNAEWMLSGRGPMRRDDVKTHALREASGGELLGAMATAVEKLTSRMDRLEVHIQMLEARLRGRENVTPSRATERSDEQEAAQSTPPAPRPEATAPPEARRRARRIADAIADRSPADAG